MSDDWAFYSVASKPSTSKPPLFLAFFFLPVFALIAMPLDLEQQYLRSVNVLNTSLTLCPVLALVDKWSNPRLRAYPSACSSGIYLLLSLSHLFPPITMGMLGPNYCLNSTIQCFILSNESTSVMS